MDSAGHCLTSIQKPAYAIARVERHICLLALLCTTSFSSREAPITFAHQREHPSFIPKGRLTDLRHKAVAATSTDRDHCRAPFYSHQQERERGFDRRGGDRPPEITQLIIDRFWQFAKVSPAISNYGRDRNGAFTPRAGDEISYCPSTYQIAAGGDKHRYSAGALRHGLARRRVSA